MWTPLEVIAVPSLDRVDAFGNPGDPRITGEAPGDIRRDKRPDRGPVFSAKGSQELPPKGEVMSV